eukprot:gene16005-20525_t
MLAAGDCDFPDVFPVVGGDAAERVARLASATHTVALALGLTCCWLANAVLRELR